MNNAKYIEHANAIGYVCIAVVLIAAIIGYVVLILKDKIDPPEWLGKPKQKS